MKSFYRDLLKHSGIYGLGQIFSRITSLLLLPIYTRYLTPSDYGCIAILDLTSAVFGIFISSGISQAANRYHFSTSDEQERNSVWWTALTIVTLMAISILAPALFFRSALAQFMLGSELPQGSLYYLLMLLNLGCNSIENFLQAYIRVQKWSTIFVTFSLSRLIMNITLNIVLLVRFEMGILSLLVGNLVTAMLALLFLLSLFLHHQKRYQLKLSLLKELWSYGSPFIVTTILAFTMHQADRYFLRVFTSMEQVGLYSFAYQIGQGVNTLILLPFGNIWNVTKFEIAGQPQAKELYRKIFHYFMSGLLLFLLAVSLFSRPLLGLIAPKAYLKAAEIIPVICLGYAFFSLMAFVTLPAVLHKMTKKLIGPSAIAAGMNLIGNILLIPLWGMTGAAWVTVMTFIILVLGNYILGRSIEVIAFPWRQFAKTLGGMFLAYIIFRMLYHGLIPVWIPYVFGGGVCLIYGYTLLGGGIREIIRLRKS